MNEILSGETFIFVYGLIVSALVTGPLVWAAILDGRKQDRMDARASQRRD